MGRAAIPAVFLAFAAMVLYVLWVIRSEVGVANKRTA